MHVCGLPWFEETDFISRRALADSRGAKGFCPGALLPNPPWRARTSAPFQEAQTEAQLARECRGRSGLGPSPWTTPREAVEVPPPSRTGSRVPRKPGPTRQRRQPPGQPGEDRDVTTRRPGEGWARLGARAARGAPEDGHGA